MRTNVTVFLTVAALLVGVSMASATVTPLTKVHESTEIYYANGTQVTVSEGGTSFTVGDISGQPLWEVIEKGWWDTENNQTIISYTIGNDSYVDPITSFHAPAPLTPVDVTAPTANGWDYDVDNGEIVWSTDDPNNGVQMTQTLNTMVVTYEGLWDIVWAPGVKVDFDGTPIGNDNWVVSTIVPAPGAALLGLLGLGCLGWMRRSPN